MDIREYLAVFRRRWLLVLGAAVFSVGAAAVVTAFIQPQYTATTKLFVTTASGSSVADAYQGNLFSQERVLSYVEVATGRQVAEKTVSELGLDTSPDDLRSMITASVKTDTVLLEISATTPNPEMSRDVANVVAAQTASIVKDLETSARGGLPTASATVLDSAETPQSPSSPSWIRNILVALVAGLAVGIVGAIVRDKTDGRVRSATALAEAADTTLLGTVPADVADRRFSDKSSDRDAGFQAVAQQLLATGRGAGTGLIVTGPSDGDGRVLSRVALGIVDGLAESGEAAVIVEIEQDQPSVASNAGITAAPGLTEVLAGTVTFSEALAGPLTTGAYALPVGDAAVQLRGGLLTSDEMGRLLKDLGSRFRWVVVVAPPVLTHPEAVAMRSNVDDVILVGRVGASSTRAVRESAERLTSVGMTLAGVVAVGSEPRAWI